MEQQQTDVPFVRRKRKGDKPPLPSPIDLQEKQSIKIDMGTFSYDHMWKPSINTLITNTGSFLLLEMATPGVLKWKPAGDVSYTFSDTKFLWAFDDYGSAHSIEAKKYALEVISTFKYSYEVVIPSEIIFKRIELHELYKELANTADEEAKKILEEQIEEKETEYNEAEDAILNDNYLHSVGKEALSHRKPTSFHLGDLKSTSPFTDNEDGDYSRDDSSGSEDEEASVDRDKSDKQGNVNLYKQVKFKKERAAIELAAKRFYPIYASYNERKAVSETRGSVESATDIIDYLRETPVRPGDSDRKGNSDAVSDASGKLDDPPIDANMFPRERDKERERARRAKYNEEKQKREHAETEQKLHWIKNHKINISLKLSVLFEVQNNAPYYSLFSYLPRVKEPFSSVLVDGNLLTPFSEFMSTTEYFCYVSGRLFTPDEEVIRIVKKTPVPILSDQLWTLRGLKNEFGKLMESTMLPTEVQKHDGRDIFFNVPGPKVEPPTCPGKDKCMCELAPETDWQAYTKI